MSNSRHVDRREFLQLMGMTAAATVLPTNIAKALTIPANNATETIQDVEHIIILMQENRPLTIISAPFAVCAASQIPMRLRSIFLSRAAAQPRYRFFCSQPAQLMKRRVSPYRPTLAPLVVRRTAYRCPRHSV